MGYVFYELFFIDLMFLSVVAVVGFELTKYNVTESARLLEVCVQVFNPPPDEELVFTINVAIQPRAGTAGTFIEFCVCVYS